MGWPGDGTSGVVAVSEIGDHCGGVGDWDNVILLLTVDGLLNGVDSIAMRGKSRVIPGALLSSDELSSRSAVIGWQGQSAPHWLHSLQHPSTK